MMMMMPSPLERHPLAVAPLKLSNRAIKFDLADLQLTAHKPFRPMTAQTRHRIYNLHIYCGIHTKRIHTELPLDLGALEYRVRINSLKLLQDLW
jgi:hypothetical protein